MNIVTFFNNKGGVGKTSLVYHLAWMYGKMGLRVLASDLDPQSNLSAMFLEEDRLEELWPDGEHQRTVLGVVQPILDGTGDIAKPYIETIKNDDGYDLYLLVGDMGLSRFEDRLSETWPKCLDGDPAAFRVTTAFFRALKCAAEAIRAELVLCDVGPNLGAINRAALVASQHVVVPLAPDLFSLQGLRNLGPTLRDWRRGWESRRDKARELRLDAKIPLPEPGMRPVGYVVMQHAARLDRPVRAYQRWAERIPCTYRGSVLGEPEDEAPRDVVDDPHGLALLKHYRSLMPLAMEARKPMFLLRPADGAIGAHMEAVRACYKDFEVLARKIAEKINLPLPVPA